MEQFESVNGQLLWNSGDTRGLSLIVNQTEYNSASSTAYIDGTYVFNGFNDSKQNPSQLNFIEIASGIKAVVWAVDIWKEVSDGRWDSNYDLFYRIIDTTSGQFLTEEVRLTDDFSSDTIQAIVPDQKGGFSIVWNNTSNQYPFNVDVTASETGSYLQNDVTSSAPEFESVNGQLLWNSGDTRGLSLIVNQTEYNSASSTAYIDGTYVFNGFNDSKQNPSQLNFIEIASGIKAVVWAVDIWKEVSDGRWDSNYDLFYRIIDTTSGQFLTEEVRLTDDFSSDTIQAIVPDQKGGFSIVWNNTSNQYPFNVDVTASETGSYLQNDVTSSAPEFESVNGQLLWNSGDTRGLSLIVNQTEYNSASSTAYIDGTYVFNGFNDSKQNPSQLNFIEIASGIKAVVWAVDIWKEVSDGRWDSNYDLFYRIIDTTSGQFLTEEVRLTDDFSSDTIQAIVPDQKGGFSIVWNDSSGDINSVSIKAPALENEGYEEITGEVKSGSSLDDMIYGTNSSDIIFAGDGDDEIYPGSGNDVVYGGFGFDIVQVEGDISNYILSQQTSNSLYFDMENGSDSYKFYDIEKIEFVGALNTVSFYLDPFWDFEKSYLGSGLDFLIGSSDKDYIETGGGSDEVYAGAGDDVVKVQGQGDSIIDTGTGDDEVVVEEDWSGTLLLKNGVGNNTLDIHQTIQSMQSVDGTDLKIVFSNGNEILIEDHYVLNANGAYEVGDTGFATIAVEGVEGVSNPFPDKELNVSQGSETSDVFRIGAEEGEEINEDVVNTLFAEAGDDTVYIGGGYNQVIGGEGDDTFYISSGKQNTTILGDLQGNDFVDNTIDIDGPVASAHVAPSGPRDVTTSQESELCGQCIFRVAEVGGHAEQSERGIFPDKARRHWFSSRYI